MKTIEQLIQETVDEAMPNGTSEQKKAHMDSLKRMIEAGKTPSAKDLGVTPEILSSLYAFAYRLYTTGKYEDALALFAWLGLLDDLNPLYPFGMASCYHMLKQYDKAINSYLMTFALDTHSPLPFFHMADCYTKLNKPDFAIVSLGQVLRQAGEDPKYSSIKEKAVLMRDSLNKQAAKASA
jgi:type III secretion system low calcium response chaperone LcrH/SycD